MSTEQASVYQQTVAEWDAVRIEREAARRAHEKNDAALTDRLVEAERVMGMAERSGVDVAAAYVVARDLLDVQWGTSHVSRDLRRHRITAEVAGCFGAAISDLRSGPILLRNQYFGVKQYDRWDSQREDHRYGMGPAHGYIWFKIGLKKPSVDLTEAQRIACIRWLRAVQDDPGLLS